MQEGGGGEKQFNNTFYGPRHEKRDKCEWTLMPLLDSTGGILYQRAQPGISEGRGPRHKKGTMKILLLYCLTSTFILRRRK